jgi:hypothetical protein
MNPIKLPIGRLKLPQGLHWGFLLALLWAPHLAAAQTATNTPATRDFSAFKIIVERNIFNPNRRPGVRPGDPGDAPKPVKIDGFSLVGTLVYDTNAYAFFDGSDARFRTVLQASNSISGLTLVEIAPDKVKFNNTSNTLELPIGMQLKRHDDGPWQLVAEAGSWSTSSDASPTRERSSFGDRPPGDRPPPPGGRLDGESRGSGASTSSSSGGSDDVLKRLMQKREQELTK